MDPKYQKYCTTCPRCWKKPLRQNQDKMNFEWKNVKKRQISYGLD